MTDIIVRVPPSGPFDPVPIPTPPAGVALASLGGVVWVDPTNGLALEGSGLAVNTTNPTGGAYSTLAQAFTSTKESYLLVPFNYVGEGILNPQALGVAQLSLFGLGQPSNALFASGVQLAGLASVGGSFSFYNIAAGDVTAQIILGKSSSFSNFNPLAFSDVFDCDITGDGSTVNVGSGTYFFRQSRFRRGGGQQTLTVNGPVIGATGALIADEATLHNIGSVGLQLAGTAPVNPNANLSAGGFWRLDNPEGAFVAHLRDAARSLNNIGGSTWNCSRAILPENTLTANRVLTVTVAGVPAQGTFRVDRYDTTAFTYTVKDPVNPGTAILPGTRTIFNVQAGVLTPLFTELLGHPP